MLAAAVRPDRAPAGRRRNDRGVAILEFAIVGVLLILLLLAIVSLGLVLSFKQNITQAAAEGARAAVGIVDLPGTPDDERDVRVSATLDQVVSEYSDGCGTDGVTCGWKIHPCTADPSDFDALVDSRPGSDECITVRVEFANSGATRLLPELPLISAFEPDELSAQSTARLETV